MARVLEQIDCQTCFTKGWLLKLGAKEAYQIAGIELPPKPQSKAEEDALWIAAMKDVQKTCGSELDKLAIQFAVYGKAGTK